MPKESRNHLNLIINIGELAALLSSSPDVEGFLGGAVRMIAAHLNADACSIYLYEEKTNDLVLTATVGRDPAAVGRFRLKPGEGLVGKTFETSKPLREGDVQKNALFRRFDLADEDRFHALIAVPIQRGVQRIGVLLSQDAAPDYFREADLMALRAAASQLAGAIENARLMININRGTVDSALPPLLDETRFIKGRTAGTGFAFGAAGIHRHSHVALLASDLTPKRLLTLADFQRAVKTTAEQLTEYQSQLAERLPETASLIFSAHFLMLKDPRFIETTVRHIENGLRPDEALRLVTGRYTNIFESSPHAHIREKARDMEDLAGRILKNMLGGERGGSSGSRAERIIIARELYPSEVLKLAVEGVKGIVLVSGGVTSHVAILSRSLRIPMIIADRRELLSIPEGTPVLLDADIGNIYISPPETVIRRFQDKDRLHKQSPNQATAAGLQPAETRTQDGVRIRLSANINLLSELPVARKLQAEGIGLYRTEFPFLIRPTFPSEEEQYLVYRRLFEEMEGRPVTIRTLDVGGEKIPAYIGTPPGINPDLGLRSLRFTLRYRDVFIQQLRAVLRAAAEHRELNIMFPMVSSLDDFREAKSILHSCKDLLHQEGLAHHEQPRIGIMIEMPGVMEILPELAAESDFFSVGTNDYIQYMLMVDRTNETVAEHYRPDHPAVLRGLSRIAKTGAEYGIDVSICGELAYDPDYLPFLVGIGIRSLSVDPQFLPDVRNQIRSLTLDATETYAESLLSESTLAGVKRRMEAWKTQ